MSCYVTHFWLSAPSCVSHLWLVCREYINTRTSGAFGPLVLAPAEGVGALWAPCQVFFFVFVCFFYFFVCFFYFFFLLLFLLYFYFFDIFFFFFFFTFFTFFLLFFYIFYFFTFFTFFYFNFYFFYFFYYFITFFNTFFLKLILNYFFKIFKTFFKNFFKNFFYFFCWLFYYFFKTFFKLFFYFLSPTTPWGFLYLRETQANVLRGHMLSGGPNWELQANVILYWQGLQCWVEDLIGKNLCAKKNLCRRQSWRSRRSRRSTHNLVLGFWSFILNICFSSFLTGYNKF